MISVVTGTLNRKEFLPRLIDNTVESSEKIELVLVDGGSTDGTLDYIRGLNHSRIKLIEVGERSSYPHFMNLGIKESTHDIVCQWNDDVYLVNDWEEIIDQIDEEYDVYLFNWKYGLYEDTMNQSWLNGLDSSSGWCLHNMSSQGGEVVMNYGLYRKKIFREIGMYNPEYRYYCADGDMSFRAYQFGYKIKDLRNVKVCSLLADKVATPHFQDHEIYNKNMNLYRSKILPETLQYL